MPTQAGAALLLANGPHLFLDDYLIAYRSEITRTVLPPARLVSNPLISGLQTGNGDNNFDFVTNVLRDPQTGQFRMWYTTYDVVSGQRFSVRIDSPDGLHWQRPRVEVPGTRGAALADVFDQGAAVSDPAQRYLAITVRDANPQWFITLLSSPDSLHWHPVTPNIGTRVAYGEIWRIFKDIGTGGFALLHRWNRSFDWTDQAGLTHHNTPQNPTSTRLFAYSSSPDLQQIQGAQIIFAPGPRDMGQTEFYSLSNIIHRGDAYIAMLDVLRDDVTAPGSPAKVDAPLMGRQFPVFGVGYTVLAWSHDGQNWFRDYETDPYFLMAPKVGSWEHAVAWINSVVEDGDSVFLYYGGYQYGHKVFVDRQIGLAMTPRDRYVAQTAGAEPGTLRTPLVTFQASSLSVNAAVARGGQIDLIVLGANGLPLPGFGPGECSPVEGDHLTATITCAAPFTRLANQPVYLQFNLTRAALFAFDLENSDGQNQ